MRGFVLTLILWCFAFQSLALAVSPACDTGSAPHAGHAEMMVAAESMDHSDMPHAGNSHAGMSHSDMPCCGGAANMATADMSGDSQAADLCQLTCASGGCAVAVPAHSLASQTVLNTLPYPLHTSALLSSTPQNLLRPPIGA